MVVNEQLRNTVFSLEIENGILISRHFEQMTLEMAQYYYKEMMEMISGKRLPLLTDFRKLKQFRKEVRGYFSQKESSGNVPALALLIETNTQELVGNIFIHYYRLKTPARIFTCEKEALEWLGQFKD